MKKAVQLGWKVKDEVTGFTGMIIGISTFLNGCRRICVQPKMDKKGEFKEDRWFDEPQLTRVGRTHFKPALEIEGLKPITGGPMPSIPTRRQGR